MNRRNFIKSGSAAGLITTIGLPASAAIVTNNDITTAFKDDFELNEITITELQNLMKNGKVSSKSITKLYLKRIEALDKKGPKLNAVIEINPDALEIASKMDEERKAGNIRGMMHGIPVLIKDNIDTADRMMTTAGSLALVGSRPAQDSFVARKLR